MIIPAESLLRLFNPMGLTRVSWLRTYSTITFLQHLYHINLIVGVFLFKLNMFFKFLAGAFKLLSGGGLFSEAVRTETLKSLQVY